MEPDVFGNRHSCWGPHTVEEISQMKSQLPHRQASRQPYTRLGKQFLGLIAAVAVGKKWFKNVRRLIGSTWESFSQPHSVPRRARNRKDNASVSRSHHCYGTRHGRHVRMHSRWGSPVFHVQEQCCDAYRTLRSLRYAALYVGDPLLPHGPNVPLDEAWT